MTRSLSSKDKRPPRPRPALLHRWYSICSSHIVRDPECPRCNAGAWHFEPRAIVGRGIFRVSPRLWRRVWR